VKLDSRELTWLIIYFVVMELLGWGFVYSSIFHESKIDWGDLIFGLFFVLAGLLMVFSKKFRVFASMFSMSSDRDNR
jgi:uncharacterized membrane protein YfcA